MWNLLSKTNRPKDDTESSRYRGTTSTEGAHSAVSSDSGSYPFINSYPTVTSTSTAPPVSATEEHSVKWPSTTSWASSYHPNGVTRKPYETDGVIKSASRETAGTSVNKLISYFASMESKSNWPNVTPVTRHVGERSNYTSSVCGDKTSFSNSYADDKFKSKSTNVHPNNGSYLTERKSSISTRSPLAFGRTPSSEDVETTFVPSVNATPLHNKKYTGGDAKSTSHASKSYHAVPGSRFAAERSGSYLTERKSSISTRSPLAFGRTPSSEDVETTFVPSVNATPLHNKKYTGGDAKSTSHASKSYHAVPGSIFAAERRRSTSSVTPVGPKRHPSGRRSSSTENRRNISHDGNLGNGRRQVATYGARGGGRVVISVPLNPWQVLGLNSSDASREAIKAAFKKKIHQRVRQNRAMVSIAHHMLTSSAGRYKRVEGTDEFVVTRRDHFMLAACGHTDELTLRIAKDGNIVERRDEHGRTLLYIASKSGFYDTCSLLLQKGAYVNEAQRDGSTPLHGAAFFGHELIVGLLLQHGAKSDIRNKWGNTAIDESATPSIRSLIQTASGDDISSLAARLKERQLVKSVRLIEYQGEVIAKELTRDPRGLDALTRDELNNIHSTWETAWHGTRYGYLESIIDKGLLPSGSSGIKPAKGHYKLGETHFGIRDWAAAIFLSPSILYASHACYSERIFSESQQWCVLVKAYCKPGSFKSYDPTVFQYEPMDGEPDMPEYRIPVTEADKNVILRVESARSVVVQSLIFVRLSFLENQNINFEQAMKLLR